MMNKKNDKKTADKPVIKKAEPKPVRQVVITLDDAGQLNISVDPIAATQLETMAIAKAMLEQAHAALTRPAQPAP